MKRYLTIAQVAAQLNVTPATVRRWVRSGILKSGRLGRMWLIPATALDELIK